ncbi:MAG: hypothetical protein NDI90_08425 [Nitrospira sp. BO4]|jgi:hypothetical protein|nr:hypothetical protein [Nitrospira sp. BO4]
MLVLMFTVLAGVLVIMASGIGSMFVRMGMLVFMFMVVSLGSAMHVFMTVDVLMRVRAFHGSTPFK